MNAVPFAMAGLGGGLVAELWPCAPYDVRDGGGSGVVGFAFEAQEGEDAIASDRVRPFRRGANTLAWIPPGLPGLLHLAHRWRVPGVARPRGRCHRPS